MEVVWLEVVARLVKCPGTSMGIISTANFWVFEVKMFRRASVKMLPLVFKPTGTIVYVLSTMLGGWGRYQVATPAVLDFVSLVLVPLPLGTHATTGGYATYRELLATNLARTRYHLLDAVVPLGVEVCLELDSLPALFRGRLAGRTINFVLYLRFRPLFSVEHPLEVLSYSIAFEAGAIGE